MKQKAKSILQRMLPSFYYNVVAFRWIFKRFPSKTNPIFFNEKVFWRKYIDQNYLYTLCSDKIKVRDFVASIIGEKYLVPLVLETDNPEDLKGLDLSSVVIKANHGCGLNIINPQAMGIERIIEVASSWFCVDYSSKKYGVYDECQYISIPKRILVERSLLRNGTAPRDYKFHCFKQPDDSVQFVLQLVNGRFDEESRGYYLNDLSVCAASHGIGQHQIPSADMDSLYKITALNEQLMQFFNYARIDWYISEGKIYFGEMTFTPGGGLSNEFGQELERKMCDMWAL